MGAPERGLKSCSMCRRPERSLGDSVEEHLARDKIMAGKEPSQKYLNHLFKRILVSSFLCN